MCLKFYKENGLLIKKLLTYSANIQTRSFIRFNLTDISQLRQEVDNYASISIGEWKDKITRFHQKIKTLQQTFTTISQFEKKKIKLCRKKKVEKETLEPEE